MEEDASVLFWSLHEQAWIPTPAHSHACNTDADKDKQIHGGGGGEKETERQDDSLAHTKERIGRISFHFSIQCKSVYLSNSETNGNVNGRQSVTTFKMIDDKI